MTSDDKITSKTVNSLFYDEIVENMHVDKNYITVLLFYNFETRFGFILIVILIVAISWLLIWTVRSYSYNYGVEFTTTMC